MKTNDYVNFGLLGDCPLSPKADFSQRACLAECGQSLGNGNDGIVKELSLRGL